MPVQDAASAMPGAKPPARIETVQVTISVDKRVLQGVLRIRPAGTPGKQEPQQALLIALYQLGESRVRPRLGCVGKLLVAIQNVFATSLLINYIHDNLRIDNRADRKNTIVNLNLCIIQNT